VTPLYGINNDTLFTFMDKFESDTFEDIVDKAKKYKFERGSTCTSKNNSYYTENNRSK
jgi:hypothetical protein